MKLDCPRCLHSCFRQMAFISPLSLPPCPRKAWFGTGLRRLLLHNHSAPKVSNDSEESKIHRVINVTSKKSVSDFQTFCEQCAGLMEQRIPPGDQRVRRVCTKCNTIAYENPKVVVGCVPISKDRKRVLLVKRAIAPLGKWTLPAGFLEVDETAEVGAAREAFEEAGARLSMQPITLLAVYDVLPAKQIQLLYRSTLLNENSIAPGEESQEVGMFEWDNIPWGELAFPTVRWALKYSIQTLEDPSILPQIKSR